MWSIKKLAIIGMQMQQSLPAFAPGSAHFGAKIPRMQGPYFKMNMEGVNGVEEMEEV